MMINRRRMYGKDGSINADSYVQDGLVFQLDGIDWGGQAGHWIERKNGYDWYEVDGTNAHTEDDCMVFNNQERFITDDTIPLYSDRTCSIECCVIYQNIGWQSIINTGNDDGVAVWNNVNGLITGSRGSNKPGIPAHSDVIFDKKDFKHIVADNTKKVSLYIDSGAFIVNGTSIETTGTISRYAYGRPVIGVLEGNSLNSNYRFKGKVYSIRIYNRQLTAEEIAHNYEIDKIRFSFPET